MSVSFNWEFQEEETKFPHHPGGDTGRPNRLRRWLVRGIVLLALLLVVGLAVRAWINSRLDAVKKVEAELQGMVEMELKTIADGDAELFRNRQDPDDSSWLAWQTTRYASGSTPFCPAPDFFPADRSPEVKDVHVIGRKGRVELVHWFRNPPSEIRHPFHSTWFYRQDDAGVWYHVAPPDDYWGVPYSWHGDYLDIRATQIEAELLDPIARDLAILVTEGRQHLDYPESVHYDLSFDAELAPRMQNDYRWTWPALYLTGMPKGDAARAAWERALKLWLVETLVQTRVDDTSIYDRVIYRHLVARLQAQLGLSVDLESLSPDVEALAQLLNEGQPPLLQDLWEAAYIPDDADANRLRDAEIAALLGWVEEQAGKEHLFELLPALGEYQQINAALMATYHMAPLNFDFEWRKYLFQLTGVPWPTSILQTSVSVPETTPIPILEPPSLPVTPGDQIAFICNDRVWVGNADGSNLVPLTPGHHRFYGLRWSPDGRWLLTSWQSSSYMQSVPYLLAADGSEGRLLMDDPTEGTWSIGWTPNGREVIHYIVHSAGKPEIWATDVETGAARQLPDMPAWSPDGEHVAYVAESSTDGAFAVWLADTEPASSADTRWKNASPIADWAIISFAGAWSPDSSKLALIMNYDAGDQVTLAVYDLATASLTPLATAGDLIAALSSAGGDVLTDGSDVTAVAEGQFRTVWPVGWSADGDQLLVWSQATNEDSFVMAPTVLAVVPLDGSPPQVLAYGVGGFMGSANWSPTHPDRLTLVWPTQRNTPEPNNTYLLDLDAGPIYTATNSQSASWSPDGAWVAFAEQNQMTIVDSEGQVRFTGQNQVTVVDQEGQARFTLLGGGGQCSNVVWNPAADLSALGTWPTLVSSEPGWSVANVRVDQDPETQALHVWGELLNYTRFDRQITSLSVGISHIITQAEGFAASGGRLTVPSGYPDMLRSISLPNGQSLPFGFTIPAKSVSPGDDYYIVLDVKTGTVRSTRDDLDITYDDFDLSAWPDHLGVNIMFENPGQPLSEYVAAVVTLYDTDERVIGWGWRYETDPAYFSSSGHYLNVEVWPSEAVSLFGLDVGSYKVHLFGR